MTKLNFESITDDLKKLYLLFYGISADLVQPLPVSGSSRSYYRLRGKAGTVIGAFNTNVKENETFFYYTQHFLDQGLPVPEVFKVHSNGMMYLMQDLGDTTLLRHITEKGDTDINRVRDIYPLLFDYLIQFQVQGTENLDYSKAFPCQTFDKQSILWDLNYFKYLFLKLLPVEFDELKLEKDFNTLANYLLNEECRYFLYRDFQSRNIMIHEGNIFFIDYQGGRKGALSYDVASLLFESKTGLPADLREELLTVYIKKLAACIPVDEKKFRKQYYGYALIRILQALGAYGYRGLYENKPLFVQSIFPGAGNLQYIAEKLAMHKELPELYACFNEIINSSKAYRFEPKNHLTITVQSFSYRKKLPVDLSGNGGGFYFDCRGLTNPGRFEKYKHLTGKNKEVQEFLLNRNEFHEFINHAKSMVNASVEVYIKREFKHLMVCFGCTGGQHRSVFSALTMANYLKNQYPAVDVIIKHCEIE